MKINFLLSCVISWLLCLSVWATSDLEPVLIEGKYGYANSSGELVIPAIYLTAEPFNEEGLALVARDVLGNGWPFEHGFIDETGREVIPLRYQHLSPFEEGFAVAQRDGKFGFITPTGAVAIDFIYSEASGFYQGKAVVTLNGEVLVIGRPNWEESILNIRETDYITFNTPSEFTSYFTQALDSFQGKTASESDYLVMERYFVALLKKMRPLEAKVEGTTVMILSQDYAEIIAESKNIYASLIEDLEQCQITPNEAMEGYLRLIYNGVANVQYNGQSVTIDNTISYQVVPFPIPYFDQSVYGSFKQNSQFNDYLTQQLVAMEGESPNLSGAEALVDYINHIFVNLEPLHLNTYFNKVTIGSDKQEEFFQEIANINRQINSTLEQYNIQLKSNVSNSLLILVDGVDTSKTVKYTLNSDYLLPYLTGIEGIRIVVTNKGEGIYLSSADLTTLLQGRDNLYFEVDYGDNVLDLRLFATDNKTEITTLIAPVFLIMPASTKTTSVYALLPDGTANNWGGVVKLNGTIEFSTTFSGEYVTKEARSTIVDIDHFSLELQEKIHFMVSKGFFDLVEGQFLPDDPLTRRELICALVRLFFAQDSSATSNFSDVPPDDPDYALISAAYQGEIVGGYEDNTFRGENLTTRYEIVSFLSRTLAIDRGFTLTLEPEESIQVYSDYLTIPDWAVENVALAVEHALVEGVGAFNGEEEVTRREVAQLLYTLFLELYDTPYASSGDLEIYKVSEGSSLPLLPLILGGIVMIATLVGTVINRKIQQDKRIMERMKLVTASLQEDLDDFDE